MSLLIRTPFYERSFLLPSPRSTFGTSEALELSYPLLIKMFNRLLVKLSSYPLYFF